MTESETCRLPEEGIRRSTGMIASLPVFPQKNAAQPEERRLYKNSKSYAIFIGPNNQYISSFLYNINVFLEK